MRTTTVQQQWMWIRPMRTTVQHQQLVDVDLADENNSAPAAADLDPADENNSAAAAVDLDPADVDPESSESESQEEEEEEEEEEEPPAEEEEEEEEDVSQLEAHQQRHPADTKTHSVCRKSSTMASQLRHRLLSYTFPPPELPPLGHFINIVVKSCPTSNFSPGQDFLFNLPFEQMSQLITSCQR